MHLDTKIYSKSTLNEYSRYLIEVVRKLLWGFDLILDTYVEKRLLNNVSLSNSHLLKQGKSLAEVVITRVLEAFVQSFFDNTVFL